MVQWLRHWTIIGREVGKWFSMPSQPVRLYQGENTLHQITSQSLLTVPDILQSLFGEGLGAGGGGRGVGGGCEVE